MESPLNNRVHFDKVKLAGLAANVKALGRVVAPILARPIKDGVPWLETGDADLMTADSFEIAAGHRRYRAAKMAQLENVPVVIQCMTDDTFIETLTVENLQREDVHPLDEAKGYQLLLKRPGYDVHVIAAKIGKEVPYVVRRLSLLRLIPPARKAFWANAINTAMALILARLTADDQKEALGKLIAEAPNPDNRWEMEHPPKADIRSSVALNAWVTKELMMDLQAAQFDTLDANLVAAAGACPDCTKRTGYAPSLFNEIKDRDLCTDRACFAGKKAAATAAQLVQITATNDGVAPLLLATEYFHSRGNSDEAKIYGSSAWTEVKSKTRCESTKLGLVVQGRERVGETIDVCTNPRCSVHAGRHGSAPESAEDIAKRQKTERDKKIDAATRQIILDQTATAFDPKKATAEDMRILARLAFQKFGNSESRKAMTKSRTGKEGYLTDGDSDSPVSKSDAAAWLKTATASELLRLAFESALYESLSFYDYGGREDHLLQTAVRWKIDAKAIRGQVASDLRTKEKAAELRKKARDDEKRAKEARAVARQEKAAGVIALPAPAAKAKVKKTKGKTVLALPAGSTAA